MRELELLAALNHIEDRYVAEAANMQRRSSPAKHIALHRVLLAAALAVVIFTLAAAAVVRDHGFFTHWFASGAAGSVRLEDMAFTVSGEAHTIADTEAFRIEAVDAIRSGHMLKAGFLVTMKGMDTALVSDPLPTIKGYCFSDVQCDDGTLSSFGYFYSTDEAGLAENQYLLVVDCTSAEAGWERVAFSLKDIGYYTKDGMFEIYYPGDWSWTFSFSESDFSGVTYCLHEPLSVQDGLCCLERIRLSGLGCEMVFSSDDLENVDVFAFFEAFHTSFSITTVDGEPLSMRLNGFEGLSKDGWQDGTLHMRAVFDAPIDTGRIQSINFFGRSYAP